MMESIELFKQGCPACGSGQHSPHCQMDGYQYVACANCQLIYQIGETQFSDIENCYSGGPIKRLRRKLLNKFRRIEQQRDFSLRMERANQIVQFALSKYPSPQRYLDIGCNKGFNIYAADEIGIESYGNELIQEITVPIRNSKPSLSPRILNGSFVDLATQYQDGFFDLITCIDVIEHFPNPRYAMEQIYRILTPGGVVVFQTPEATRENKSIGAQWKALKPNEHLLLFDQENFLKFAQEIGFVDIDFAPQPFEVCDGNFVATCRKPGN
jgi:2-polyprenyl-3-methyl-5-hydroxy-6-metoxy-1,4-benzoquinol methylase